MATNISKRPKIMQPPTFKSAKRRAPAAAKPFKVPVLPTDDQLPTTIQGKAVGSPDEARVCAALDLMQHRYRYQVSVAYGRERRGGQVLDILDTTFKPATVIDVRAEYWHTGEHEDSLSIEKVCKDYGYGLLPIWDKDTGTVDAALSFLRQNLPQA